MKNTRFCQLLLISILLQGSAFATDLKVICQVTGFAETNWYLIYDIKSKEAANIDPGWRIDTNVNKRNYRSWIKLNYKSPVMEGMLQQINDSSIQLLRIDHFPVRNKKDNLTTISTSSIESIKVRRKGSIGKGMLIGGVTGAIIGALVSMSVANQNDKSTGIYVYPIMITGCGVGLGALFGSIKIKITINGNQDNFNYSKQELTKYSNHP